MLNYLVKGGVQSEAAVQRLLTEGADHDAVGPSFIWAERKLNKFGTETNVAAWFSSFTTRRLFGARALMSMSM